MSMKIKVDVDGIDKVRRKLGAGAADDLEDAIELEIGNGARKEAVMAAKDSPVETGALRASLLSSPRRAGTMTYYWGTRLPYGLRQEYEHKTRMGWMRNAWNVGNRMLGESLTDAVKRRLGG